MPEAILIVLFGAMVIGSSMAIVIPHFIRTKRMLKDYDKEKEAKLKAVDNGS